MNTETGKVYEGEAEIAAAFARGEKLVPVSKKVARLMKVSRATEAARLRAHRATVTAERNRQANRDSRKAKRAAMAKASRRKNRRR
jgi:hypothetical protein